MKSDAGALAPEWRSWVVENLLRGTDAAELVSVLKDAGVDAVLAREAVRAEAEDPCFQGAAKALAYHRKLEGLFDLYGDLHQQAEDPARVDRHESLSPEDFFGRYYFQNRPVVVRGAVVEEASLTRWAHARLPAGDEFTWVPLADHAELLESLRPPTGYVVADLDASRPMLWRTVEGFRSRLQLARKNLLVCQVHGRQRFRLVPPFGLHHTRELPESAEDLPLRVEVELGPCELLLLPVSWGYEWQALESGSAVSFEAFATSVPNTELALERAPPRPTPPPWSRAG